jgi:LCP family protein required for cell wall assembly
VAVSVLLAACGPAVAAMPSVATSIMVTASQPPVASAAAPLAGSATPRPALPGTPPQGSAASLVPSRAVTAQPTAWATATPTAADKAEPTLGAFNITPIAGATLVTPNPTALPAVHVDDALVNVLLIGTDIRPTDSTFRTDTLIVASINKSAGTVSLLSIPRDLYVYVPKYGMARINQAFQAAERNGYPGGGPALLEQTLLYNLGLPIHYYASVNFDGFRRIVDTLGGIQVPVNCQLTEYKLKDPALDERDAANYELFTQPIGVAEMDGALALWYARARPVGGDFFRGYRQRQVLRALYHQGLRANVVPRLPALYGEFRQVVETDMTLWDVMQFVPLAGQLGDAQIRSLNIGPNQVTAWTTPAGEAVLLPRGEPLLALVNDFLAGAAANRLARALTWIEIVNGAGDPALDPLAAETLTNEGFAVRYGEAPDDVYAATSLVDYSTSAKGSPLKRLQSVLHLPDTQVLAQPNADSPVQFRLVLGRDYNPCPRLDWMDTSGAESGN